MADTTGFTEITSEDELRALLGEPMPRAVTKDRVRLRERAERLYR
jgi:hypothetical protein